MGCFTIDVFYAGNDTTNRTIITSTHTHTYRTNKLKLQNTFLFLLEKNTIEKVYNEKSTIITDIIVIAKMLKKMLKRYNSLYEPDIKCYISLLNRNINTNSQK